MSRRTWLFAGGGVLAICGMLALYDVLVETDEERLEAFVPDVSGSISEAKVERTIGRWVDLERAPLEISALGEALAYRAGEEDALLEDARERLQPFFGSNARVISSGIEVEDDRARITLRLMNDRLGLQTVEWTLERHGDDWLVTRLSVQR